MHPNLTTPCLYLAGCHDCGGEHVIGRGNARFRWNASDPLAVNVTALTTFGGYMQAGQGGATSFWIARDTLWTGVRSGRKVGCPVVGEGDVTLKIMSEHVTTLSIRWKPGYTMHVDRDAVSRWVDETYTIVPQVAENEIIDMDGIIQKILESK